MHKVRIQNIKTSAGYALILEFQNLFVSLMLQHLLDHSDIFTRETRHKMPDCKITRLSTLDLKFQEKLGSKFSNHQVEFSNQQVSLLYVLSNECVMIKPFKCSIDEKVSTDMFVDNHS